MRSERLIVPQWKFDTLYIKDKMEKYQKVIDIWQIKTNNMSSL